MVLKDFLSTLESSDDSPYWLIFLGWIETMKTRKNHSYGTTSGSAAASGGPVVAATDGKGSSQVCDLFSFLTLYLISLSLLYYIYIYECVSFLYGRLCKLGTYTPSLSFSDGQSWSNIGVRSGRFADKPLYTFQQTMKKHGVPKNMHLQLWELYDLIFYIYI